MMVEEKVKKLLKKKVKKKILICYFIKLVQFFQF